MTAQAVVFYLFAFVAVFAAVMVISRDNPVHSALWLILNLISVAILYYTLNAPFLMAAQLIVYAGAIVVLFVFVMMMLSTQEERRRRDKAIGWVRPLGVGFAVLFFIAVFIAIQVKPDTALLTGAVEGTPYAVGRTLFRDFLLPFEATAILLLAALVGAMYLGRHGDRGEMDDYGLTVTDEDALLERGNTEAETREEIHV